MRLFTRYILSEVLRLFLVALIAVTSLLVIGLVVERAVAENMSPVAILKLIPYILPFSLQYALPTTLLFAVCVVYGRMSADNEVIAVKSAGVNPIAIIKPILLLGFILSPVAVWLTDIAASWGTPGMHRVVMHSIEEIVYSALRSQKIYVAPSKLSIYVKDVEGKWLISPVITIYDQGGGDPKVISAEKARISLNPEPGHESLVVDLVDYQGEMGKTQIRSGRRDRIELPLERATRKGNSTDSPTQYSIHQMSSEIQAEQAKLRLHEDALIERFGTAMALGRMDFLGDQSAKDIQFLRDHSQSRLYRLKVEPWRRWALGFSCFFFVWMGIPLAIRMKSADYWMTFGACFLPILLIYFPLFGLGLHRAKSGDWPVYSVWLGNLMLFAIGAWMIRSVRRS